jgi:dihydropyrimidinase
MKDLLIKGGLVVIENAQQTMVEEVCDILCSAEKIKQIGKNISSPGAEVIDATGMIVIPGGVDVHTHLCLDTGTATVSDDFYTGTLAAA